MDVIQSSFVLAVTFNPTMVRLQLVNNENRSFAPRSTFNPTMVRLQQLLKFVNLAFVALSIPLWCDCNEERLQPPATHRQLSIPLWCDCNLRMDRGRFSPRVLSIPLWCDCN